MAIHKVAYRSVVLNGNTWSVRIEHNYVEVRRDDYTVIREQGGTAEKLLEEIRTAIIEYKEAKVVEES